MIVSPITVASAPRATSITSSGSYTYTIPSWCTHIDVIIIGGGGGGGGGDTGWTYPGQGGYPGLWSTVTLERGRDVSWAATVITGSVGIGGTAGAVGSANNGGTGGTTTATYTTMANSTKTITTPGGIGGNGGNNGGFSGEVGKSPGNQTYNNQTYTGGSTAVSGTSRENGKVPGGGGGGGAGGVFGAGTAGMPGASGGVFFYAYMKKDTLPTAAFTDSLDSLTNFTTASSGSGITTVSGIVQWNGTTAGQAIALYNQPATSNNQYGAIYANAVTTTGSGIILHSDSGYTGYYGAVFYNGFVKLVRTSGRWTQNTITELATYVMVVQTGDFVEFWNFGNIFYISVNNTIRITYPVQDLVIGPAYRYQGFGMYRTGSSNSVQITEWRGGDAAAWGKI